MRSTHAPRPLVAVLVALVAVALFAAACGDDTTVTAGDAGTTTSAPTTTTPDTTGSGGSGREPDDVVLAVTSEGGFVPVEFLVDRGPRLVLLADGRLIGYGPVPAIHPSPLLPNTIVTRLDEATLERVGELVDAVGFADFTDKRDDSANSRVADATTEVVTWYDPDGSAHTYSVYALGLVPEDRPDDVAALAELVDLLSSSLYGAADAEPWVGDTLLVTAGPGQPDPDFPDTRPWPLPDPPDTLRPTTLDGWVCATYDGAVRDELLDVFATATTVTTWDHEGTTWRLKARPVLPGETPCT